MVPALYWGRGWSTGNYIHIHIHTHTHYCMPKASNRMLKQYMAGTSNPDLGSLAMLPGRRDTEPEA